MPVLPIVLTTLMFVATTSCTTMFGGRDEDSLTLTDGREAIAVVIQPGKEKAAYSRKPRKFWVDIRTNTKDEVKKMYAALASGESIAAGDLARERLKKYPGDQDGLVVLAGSLALDKKYDLAAYYSKMILKKDPGHPLAHNILGLQAMMRPKSRMADFNEAIGHYARAFENDNEVAGGLNLGNLYLELGNSGAAEQVFAEVSKRCENCIDGLMGYGIATSRNGRYQKAVAIFDQVLDQQSNHSGALYQMALVQQNGYRNQEKAIDYLETLLAESKTSDTYVKERAQSTLRKIKTERPVEPIDADTMIAEDEPTAPQQDFEPSDELQLIDEKPAEDDTGVEDGTLE